MSTSSISTLPLQPGGPKGYQQLAVSNSAVGLTVPAGAVGATVITSGQAVNYRADGTNPDSTHGMPVAAGSTITLTGAWLTAGKFIAQTGTATLNATFFD